MTVGGAGVDPGPGVAVGPGETAGPVVGVGPMPCGWGSVLRQSAASCSVVVPSVAELPTCQKTLHGEPPLISTTDEAVAVVRVLPCAQRMKVAVSWRYPAVGSVSQRSRSA